MSDKRRIILYNKKLYALSENQFEALSDVFITAESLPADIPLAAPVHVQAHVHSATSQYEFLGNIDSDVDTKLSLLFKESCNKL
jgi:hypothetical protein